MSAIEERPGEASNYSGTGPGVAPPDEEGEEMHQLLSDRGVQASILAGAGLAVLTSTNELGWPLWAVWALVTGWAVVEARRTHA